MFSNLLHLLVLSLCALNAVAQFDDPDPEALAHAAWVRANYTKTECRIPMRDGVRLFTSVYAPNWSKGPFPVVLFRTPYSVAPYGADAFRLKLGPDPRFDRDGFIFVFQDARGCFMSEGSFMNMRPHQLRSGGKKAWTNESSDTFDSIDWLIANLPHNNGKVGQWGISYPGFYAAAGMISNHPALKIVSPQAPIADWFWDDMHHNGAFSLNLAFNFLSGFGAKREGPQTKRPDRVDHGTQDGYQFFLDLGPLSNVNKNFFNGEIAFWNDLAKHPNYDWFWQVRNLLPHLKNISCAVLTVGGLFDAEDLYGPFKIYREVEKNNPNTINSLVIGPWSHGGWARTDGDQLGDSYFGFKTSEYYAKQVILPSFLHYLKDGPDPNLPEALVFETGANRWRSFDQWPPVAKARKLFMRAGGNLSFEALADKNMPQYDAFISDPHHPVPSTTAISTAWGRDFMAEDQRYAGRRPDVLSYQSDVLSEDLTLCGPIVADLWVSTDQSAADWVVKIIDVFPPDAEDFSVAGKSFERANAALLVRYEMFRGRFRESFEKPVPFEPGKVTRVKIELQDVLHTFQKGHRLMVQVQSSFFPFFDRNPQTYVANIFEASEEDFVVANHRLWRSKLNPSHLVVSVLE